jgi:hypothetical protein
MPTVVRLFLATLILWLGGCSPPGEPGEIREAKPEHPTALEVAQSIFDQITLLRISGLPDDSQMAALAQLLSDELRRSMEAARAWQKGEIERMQREGSEDKPPFIEGDLFGSLFEGAQSTRAVVVSEADGRIRVTLDRSYGSAGDRVQWQDRAVLTRVADGYRLDDVEYGGNWAFQAGSGTLRNTLKARE